MKHLLLFFKLFLSVSICAQTSVSGIINSYAAVSNIEVCFGEITVDDASDFSEGDRVMLIQMQGASMVEENSSDFGTIIDLNSCGLYEMNAIGTVTGNTINLQFSLVNTYNTAARVQLVRVPVYQDAEITGEITPQPWDGQTGGIIALEVEGTLTLSADINADGAGFRGGLATVVDSGCTFILNQTDYTYPAGNWRSSPKGEGIVPFIQDKEWGRGPQANGGGGGNDHNAGGGGGGNAFPGGQGGNRSPDGNFDCDGDFPGRGGVVITTNSNRVFLGGGGGAGHTNNTGAGSDGGNGGGIIYVKASTLQGNGGAIHADGLTNDTAGDGAGGGGAGGSIILLTNTNNGNPSVTVRGGRGGNTVANSGSCNGPGGGGSGGRLLTNTPAGLSPGVEEGVAGVNDNPNGLCNGASNGATSGQAGNVETITAAPESNDPLTALSITQQAQEFFVVCQNSPFTISVEVEGIGLNYQWQADSGSGFEDLNPSGTYTGETTASLTVDNPMNNMTGWLFRLIITSNCGEEVISTTTEIEVTDSPTAGFTFDLIAPLTYQFNDNSNGASSVTWDFDDMAGSNEQNPTHVFSGPGTYVVTQTISSSCGTDVAQVTVELGVVPTAAFSSDVTSGCSPLSVNFLNESAGSPSQLEWQFPGGSPNNILNDPEPTIMYPNAGLYDVILIASNGTGTDTITLENYINVSAAPVAMFTFDVQGNEVSFFNDSFAGESYEWDFGDTESSNLENPVHTYASSGFYDVTLTATNPCGSTSVSLQIAVGSVPNASFGASQNIGCGSFEVQFFDNSTGEPSTWDWQFPGGTPASSAEQNPIISYNTPGVYTVSLAVSNATGNTFLLQDDYITVEAFPDPEFSAVPDPSDPFTYNFTNLTTTQVNQYNWDFGDGNTDSGFNATHTYSAPGTYQVTLNALNSACGGGTTQTLAIFASDTDEASALSLVKIYPSPFSTRLFVDLPAVPEAPVALRLTGVEGKIFSTKNLINLQSTSFDTEHLPPGVYILQMLYAGEVFSVKVVK